MQVALLGPLEVRIGDAAVEIRRGLPRTLLIALALRAGETVSSDSLVELLWGDDQPQNPANALQIQVSYLRKAIAQAGAVQQPIVTKPGGYALDVRPDDVDARRFEAMVREGARAAAGNDVSTLTTAAGVLTEALALWRGEPLADVVGESFAIGEVTRLGELRWEAIERRNDVLLALGRHRELVGELSQLVTANPLRERFHEQLMLALYRSGRQADALRAYDDARKILIEELGLDPGPQLQQLERDILAQSPELAWRPPSGAEAPVELGDPAHAPAPPLLDPPRIRAASLPNPVTPLIGRRVETDRVGDLLDRNRAVTLTGPAGAGKTRLAIEVAHSYFEADDVVYVDLAAVGAAEQVPQAVATAVGISAPVEGDPADVVAQWFVDRSALLLLDTCEHVLPGAAAVASRVLRTAPHARVLATSRRALAIAGEIAWPVPPLALAPPSAVTALEAGRYPAVELFCRRAAAVRPDFALTDANAADVAAICLALDGLPLAIELVSARADVLTPAAIRARLENRFSLLVDGSSDVAPRQQTLRAAIDWSFELLDADQRQLFGMLSVFAGGFDLDAVVALAGDHFADPVSALAGLVRHSVVMVAGDDRYRLLDSLRAYGSDVAATVIDAEVVRRRHAEHYAALAEAAATGIRGPEQVEWLERVRRDVPNFRAALGWAFAAGADDLASRLVVALGWFWTLEGMLDEAVSLLERAAVITSADDRLRAEVHAALALLAASLGELDRALDAASESVRIATASSDASALGNALNALAVVKWSMGELDDAAAHHDDGIAAFASAQNDWGIAVCSALRARTAVDRGEAAAQARAEEALVVARRAGDRHVIALALEQLARIAVGAGDAGAGVRHATSCLELVESIGYTEGTIAALHLLGRARLLEGDVGAARVAHARGLSLAASINHASASCEAVEDLARVTMAAGRPADALRLLAAAERQRRARGIPRRRADCDDLREVRASAVAAVGVEAHDLEVASDAETFDEVVRTLLG
ncbi:MAG TPA: BTAD domain-containing putative transcriptional regulator [Acidimicrobiales bacterium]|nr:BTAD domain-containing putative transcriptional regulator [Acidimicrobiales bacterium]